MELIIRLKNNLNQDEIQIIKGFNAKITFQSAYIPLIGISLENPAFINDIKKLPFVMTVRSPQIGEYLEGDFLTTFFFTPFVSRKALSQYNYYGWGDTRVAIIDSGVNRPSVVEHIDYTNTGHNDIFGHGSYVADIIKYFAKGANLYSAKVGNDRPDDLAVMRALEWAAIEKGVHVINLSVGFKPVSRCKGDCDMAQIINGIVNSGAVVIVAAGNDGPKNNTLRCPSCASSAITVGALEDINKVFDYSSRGPVGGSKPNIVAPGRVQIDENGFGGTSCASPVVAGSVAAVISSVADVNLVYKALYDSANDIGLSKNIQGVGALNVERFVEVIKNETMDSAREGQE
ncbi:MAG: S8 family serine peptidase [Bacillota bacterium]